MNETLVFTPGGDSTQCFDVSIDDDSIYERSEVFSLSLNPLESAHIQLTNSTIFVEILDSEGTCTDKVVLFACYLRTCI